MVQLGSFSAVTEVTLLTVRGRARFLVLYTEYDLLIQLDGWSEERATP